ncbi:VOC family protein [Prosthecomicrobium hirschii]|uniref:VOC family protein n=1 Tax=Prosthecodimorpha hirschii TaxID=665126 RepID=UPI00221EFDCC|nr:VOC family protein [Prosthecomicrobium hirschii]MCW1841034.1 VOC family protein [Prosthecomicrobium hirschii]
MSKITTCLWYERDAETAARLYVSLFADSQIDAIHRNPIDGPSGAAGSVLVVEFTLAGRRHMALNGGMAMPYSNAVSIYVDCADQAEVDRLWDALLADGGRPEQCGWLRDRWDVPWQIIPAALPRLIADPDPARASRAMAAMMEMVKIDIAALERAADG